MQAKSIATVVSFAQEGDAGTPYRPPAERILDGDPLQTASVKFTSRDGAFLCGSWTCQPGRWRVIFTENEFCHILAGVLQVTDEQGAVSVFRAGDAFVSPAGFTGIWEVIEPTRKLFAVYEPAAGAVPERR